MKVVIQSNLRMHNYQVPFFLVILFVFPTVGTCGPSCVMTPGNNIVVSGLPCNLMEVIPRYSFWLGWVYPEFVLCLNGVPLLMHVALSDIWFTLLIRQ